jgi:hypothetical protein
MGSVLPKRPDFTMRSIRFFTSTRAKFGVLAARGQAEKARQKMQRRER